VRERKKEMERKMKIWDDSYKFVHPGIVKEILLTWKEAYLNPSPLGECMLAADVGTR
jgi:hypothetical protein